ncbi:hypothetical protein RFI_02791 [Reticulomyxa filosa]|uniref:Uncharacterized protein n=1 Tax=Reticulomyxa filosa TaxID=46433 RepID=X6P8A3_RETFI|nr:hypothetical protein RFI_02791 [Reticulomyxa filosa]|eukprot:ETO34304.1 hypothetical protein RFI_02791 [Reticulomyxa filosa]
MSSISEESEVLDALILSYLDDLEGSPQDLSVNIDWGESSASELVQKTQRFCDIEKYITNDTLIISREDLTLDIILEWSKIIWKESIITILCETLNQGIIGTDNKFKKRKLQYQIPTKMECITIIHLKLNYCIFEGKGLYFIIGVFIH